MFSKRSPFKCCVIEVLNNQLHYHSLRVHIVNLHHRITFFSLGMLHVVWRVIISVPQNERKQCTYIHALITYHLC